MPWVVFFVVFIPLTLMRRSRIAARRRRAAELRLKLLRAYLERVNSAIT